MNCSSSTRLILWSGLSRKVLHECKENYIQVCKSASQSNANRPILPSVFSQVLVIIELSKRVRFYNNGMKIALRDVSYCNQHYLEVSYEGMYQWQLVGL